MKRFNSTKGIVILLLLIFMLISYYFYLSNRHKELKEESVVETKVQEVLTCDLSRNYPATPKEVVKYYSEITQCFYNEEYTEEDLKQLADRAMLLYDAELAAAQNGDEYLANLKSEIASYKQSGIVISSYKTSNSTDVVYFSKDGYECASLYCTYMLREGGQFTSTDEVFILRKDTEGHWKIFGWDVAPKEDGE